MQSAQPLVVNIVTWNSARYLPNLFASLDAQQDAAFTVTAVDNASTDGTLDWLMEHRPDVALLRNFRNQGFARAHNQAIALALSRWDTADLSQRYVMVANPDLEFAPDALHTLVAFMDAHPDVSACGPKLLRATVVGESEDGGRTVERTRIIDAMGIAVTKARRFVDRGAGEEDTGQYDADTRVFGLSGACMLLRASALVALRVGEEIFDEDFFAYQEDTDLAWRMRLFGMESQVVPQAVAWHHRRIPTQLRGGWIGAWVRRMRKPAMINFLSSRNHGWMVLKNDQGSNLLWHLPWWLPYEALKSIAAIFSPSQMRGQLASVWGVGSIWRKRRIIQKRALATPPAMRAWFR
ncbi:MAG: hypothetical protein RL141_88 [Candidatus Parcubacteria bacterium]|jgi:GT2 family glycosyltransferase